MSRWNFEVYAERGLDNRMVSGYFNAAAESLEESGDSWWELRCRLEAKLLQEFPTAGIYVGDGSDEGKVFYISAEDELQAAKVVECALSFRDAHEPETSVMLGYVLHAPVPVARLVFGAEKAGLDQDALGWFLQRSAALKCFWGVPQTLSDYFASANALTACPWADNFEHTTLSPAEFWSKVYSGRGLEAIKEEDHQFAYEITGALGVLMMQSEHLVRDNFFTSARLKKHRLLKIEVDREVFNEALFREVVRIVRGFGPDWAVRFAVFEDLCQENSYLGSIISDGTGILTIESP
jgi:hypothetical protein